MNGMVVYILGGVRGSNLEKRVYFLFLGFGLSLKPKRNMVGGGIFNEKT